MRSRRHLLPLALVLLLATILRLQPLTESLWLDELHTAWSVMGPADEIVARAQLGNQTPCYFFVTWACVEFLGGSEWSLRLPSLLAGLGLVGVIYGFTWQLTRSPLVASLSGVLAALDHNCIFYATEARPYALVQLAAVVHLWLFWMLQQRRDARLFVAWLLLGATLFHLHYTAMLIVGGELAAYCLYRLLRRGERDVALFCLRDAIVAALTLGVLCLPALPHLVEVFARRGNWAAFVVPQPITVVADWFNLTTYAVAPVVLVIMFAVINAWFARRQRTIPCTSPRPQPVIAMLVVCFVLPISCVWLTTSLDLVRLLHTRYLIGLAVLPIIFAGVVVATLRVRWQRLLASVVIVVLAIESSAIVSTWRASGRVLTDRSQDWRAAVGHIHNSASPAPVFVFSGFLEANRLREADDRVLVEYCLAPVNSLYELDADRFELIPLPGTSVHPGAVDSAWPLNASQVSRIHEAGSAWFLVNSPPGGDASIEAGIHTSLRNSHVRIHAMSFGTLELRFVEVTARPTTGVR